MPCWFYDKKELRNTPSFKDNIDPDTESRYRREGARFVLDCGTKLGLRYDTCGTGAIYFHRFYMYRSFREFHRYVTACSCLFLAGKVEETPKKCKDLIRITKSMLTEKQFNKIFGDDAKEEIVLVERILLQTLRFDLMVEHPYSHLLRFGKMLRGDKNKVQKVVQMSWTFINDSLCTTLCLQWEAEVIGVALIYLATRLSKVDIHDWEGKPSGFQGKWFEHVIKEVNLELLEDICHQVLDLYSQQMSADQHAKQRAADSPPPPPPPPPPPQTNNQTTSTSLQVSGNCTTPSSSNNKRSRSNTPVDVANKKFKGHGQPVTTTQSIAIESITTGLPNTPSTTPSYVRLSTVVVPTLGGVAQLVSPNKPTSFATLPASIVNTGASAPTQLAESIPPVKDGDSYSPFISTYSSSFMSGESSKSIQTLMGHPQHLPVVAQKSAPFSSYQTPNFSQPPPNVQGQSYTPTSFTPRPHYHQPPPAPTQGSYSNFQPPPSQRGNTHNYSQESGYKHNQSYGGHTSYSNQQNYDEHSGGSYSDVSGRGAYSHGQQYYPSHHQQNYHNPGNGHRGSGPPHRQHRM